MAKDHSEKPSKKEKKLTEDAGVKKSKKDKKSRKSDVSMADASEVGASLLNDLEETNDGAVEVVTKEDVEVNGVNKEQLLAAMVPFANPMADEKAMKKVLKSVKRGTFCLLPPMSFPVAQSLELPSAAHTQPSPIAKPTHYTQFKLTHPQAAKHKTLKRGVKEVVKSLRKSTTSTSAPAVVVLAADISPFDVISHIPVLCEDHNVPYIYVPSRAELGAAGNTKRPTSVVMMVPKAGEEEWTETYGDLVKVVEKAQKSVKV